MLTNLHPLPHPLVQLAAEAIQAYVCHGRRITPADARQPIEGHRAGVFVTLHTCSTGDLRGCIGTISPTQDSLAHEVIANAISAAVRDPRFRPVRPEELSDLQIDVSVLYPPEPIGSQAELDPSCYGVIVEEGMRRGLLLPNIEGIDDAQTQVSYARMKAGIRPNASVRLFRFRVEKYT